MRALLVGLLVAFASPVYAEDKDEDKAKEVVAAFLKAAIAKDLDAMMKVADVPFVVDMGSDKTIEKRDELKEAMAKLIEKINPEKVMGLEAGKVYDMAGLAKYVKDKEVPEKYIERVEKLVGKDGRMVLLKKGEKEELGFLIRFKDGKAFVVGLPR